MHADTLAGGEALVEIIALHHSGYRVFGRQLNHAACAQRVAPFAVVANFGFAGIEHQAGLFVIRLGVFLNLLAGQRRAGGVAA